MSDNENNELLSILDGNVGEVKAALEGKTDDELNILLSAEEAGNTRKGVIEAIDKLLEHAQPTRADEINAEIEALESQAIDINAAKRLHALRAELADEAE